MITLAYDTGKRVLVHSTSVYHSTLRLAVSPKRWAYARILATIWRSVSLFFPGTLRKNRSSGQTYEKQHVSDSQQQMTKTKRKTSIYAATGSRIADIEGL